MITSQDALARLKEGNRRFALDQGGPTGSVAPSRRRELLEGQLPFAVILGCSDSRVPAELIFDQGLGDLFVIRVAGNIVAPSQVGSVEFATAKFGTPLVVVLGHTGCGAIQATLDELELPTENQSPNLRSIVGRIAPAVAGLLQTEIRHDRDELVRQASRANLQASVDHLKHGSAILEDLIENHGLIVVGAEYSLETGLVEFFIENPASDS